MSWLSQALGGDTKAMLKLAIPSVGLFLPSKNTKSPAPSPTAASTAQSDIQQTQADILNLTLEQMGYKRDASGKMVRMTEEERLAAMSPEQKANQELSMMLAEREKAALAGNLPVSPMLEKELAMREEATRANLARRLGPDYLLSTPGSQTISNMNIASDLTREEARRGMLTTTGDLLNQNLSTGGGLYGQRVGAGATTIGAGTSMLEPYMLDTKLRFEQLMQQQATKAQKGSDWMRLLGMGAGALLGGPLGATLGSQVGSWLSSSKDTGGGFYTPSYYNTK